MFSLSDDSVDDDDDRFVICCGGRGWRAFFAPPLRREITLRLVKSMMSLAAHHTDSKSACKLVAAKRQR